MQEKNLAFLRENAPCYVYDRRRIIERCEMLRAAMPDLQFLYSVKAHPFKPVVETIAKQGFGADAASANEVLLAAQAGISDEMIFYSAPGKTLANIEKAWGKCVIIADSFSELELLEKYAAGKNEVASVGVRINPNFSMKGTSGAASKFGIDEALFKSKSLEFPHLKITGIHVHLRSQILDTELLCSYYQNCYTLAERLSKLQGVELSFINFGSGIGTVYDEAREKPLDFEKLGQAMQELRQYNLRSLNAKFILETGRFLVCNAGSYYTRIVDKKRSGRKTFLVVQNAMNGFLRPALAKLLEQNLGFYPEIGHEPLYTSARQSRLRVLGREGDLEIVDVVGNLCTSLDVLAEGIILPHAEIGDIIEVSNAGSYGRTLSPLLFSSQDEVKEFLLDDFEV